MPRPIGIDLFAGAGGLSLGFEQAGFDVVAAVEIDPIHCLAHKFNFPYCTVVPRSISDITGDEIRRLSGIGRKRVDVVFGGPPCQGFSLMGQRAFDDPRNRLVKDFVRVLSELKASYFVFENVKGLTVGDHRRFLEELIDELGNAGYRTLLPWQVLDTADFGVPQHRERLILIGARKGFPLPHYPSLRFWPRDRKGKALLPAGPSCMDAIGDLPNVDEIEQLQWTDEALAMGWGTPSRYARELRCLTSDCWHYGHLRKWERRVLTSSLRTGHTDISQRRFVATPPGEVEPISRFYKLSPGGLSNTLRAGTDSARGAFTSPRPIHYRFPRCITVREMARIHGYPDWFRFHITKWHGARQVGNSVPPPLARAVALEVGRALRYAPQRGKPIAFGDPKWLSMNMSEAAAFLGVDAPIAKRDRKSGAKKRKQIEIDAGLSTMLPFEDSRSFDH